VRLLVIGGSGFVGSAVVRSLQRLGGEVATFHRGEGASIRGDRAQLATHREAFARIGAEVVLDTIAYTEEEAGTLVGAFRGLARRLVVLSSQDVYAPYGRLLRLETGGPNRTPAAEDAPLRHSRFPYRAKARTREQMPYHYEKILVERAASVDPELPATLLRLPCVYGPGDGHHRVGKVLALMRSGGPVVLDRAKASWRWTRGYVENVADAIALAATDARAADRTYNIGDERALTELEWTSEIGRAAGTPAEVRTAAREELPPELAEPFDFAHDLVADTRRIRAELGYRERVGLAEGLAASIAWEGEHPS
jgi:nucleoside-diphosphate-sugar epimerase